MVEPVTPAQRKRTLSGILISVPVTLSSGTMTLDHENVRELESLSSRYGFNLNFEGGEAETIVVDCPIVQENISD